MSAQDLATLQVWGAGGFGAVIGWYLYFINRYRKGDVQIGDITTVIGAIGGGAVTALFDPHKTGDLFSAYGLGLAIGFFTYFLVLVLLVGHSKSFTSDWFLDGRRPNPPNGWGYAPDAQQSVRALDASPGSTVLSGGTQNFYISPPPAGAAFVPPAQAAAAPIRPGGEKTETPVVGI